MKRQRSTILSPERARLLGYALASLSALVVVTCAGAAKGPVSSAPAPAGAGAPTPSAAPSRAPVVLATAAPEATQSARAGAPLSLPRFRAALEELAAGRRSESVRVLWMGDSHAAADFWPDSVRRPLAQKYGGGGPGFLYVGLGVYRHAGVKVEREGHFRTEPKQPSLWMRQGDGVFGLGGMRVVPEGDACRVTLELSKDAVRGGARWDLAFRLPTEKARFLVTAQGGQTISVDSTTEPVGSVAHLEWKTEPGATVTIDHASGEPQLFGVVVDGSAPGVVVDTLGINGARIGTPLAWEEAPWLAEASRRDAALVVLSYGTNEVGDQAAVHRYGPELEALILRVRKAAPKADCLVVGPTDRAGPGWVTLPRVAEIDAVLAATSARVGCAFWSTVLAMGGEGSLKRWAEQSPPLAAPDHVHLTPRGYGELGAKMVAELVPEAAP